MHRRRAGNSSHRGEFGLKVDLASAASLITAVAAILWPTLGLCIYFSLRRPIRNILSSGNFKGKIGNFEITVGKVADELQRRIDELDSRISQLDGAESPIAAKSVPVAMSILWVDDNPSNNAYHQSRLRDLGFQIELAFDTGNALTKLKQMSFDIVISDMHRVEDGVERKTAGLELLNHMGLSGISIPLVFFCSSLAAVAYRDVALAQGAVGITASSSQLFSYIGRLTKKSMAARAN
jgi:CheY-like chemotaxis protein